jgi:hypothetical protein
MSAVRSRHRPPTFALKRRFGWQASLDREDFRAAASVETGWLVKIKALRHS